MVVVTMGFAREVADRAFFMDDGPVVEEGSTEDLFTNTRHERTKSFLSKVCNFLILLVIIKILLN